MAEIVVKINSITKKYHGCIAVNQCSLTLEKGKIYGLVGKNGAGKTTIMRMIAGLSIPTSGEIELFGKSVQQYYQEGAKEDRIGSLIESPSLNGAMTAKENIKFYRKLTDATKSIATDEEILQLVGLDNIEKRKVKDYSLGMKQRLGIAIALLSKPEFIMLDEPINGLDPVGVVEIRNLIQKLNTQFNMTVLISSHNLPELYQTATDYIIIDRGTVKKEITQEQLEEEKQMNLEEYFLSVIGQ